MEVSRDKKKKFFKKTSAGSGGSSNSSVNSGGRCGSMEGQGSAAVVSSQWSLKSSNPTIVAENGFGPKATSSTNSNSSGSRRPTTASTNSSSVDETEARMTHDRRFVTAPRRARSAERFDGIRVALSNSCAGFDRDELLSRNFHHSPQPFSRNNNNNGLYIPRSADSLSSIPKAIASPPPPYSATAGATPSATTILDKSPPTYKQAVAMTQKQKEQFAAAAAAASKNKQLNNRFAGMNHHHGSHSFEANNGFSGRGTLRSAASVPTFKDYNNTTICSCAKCQVRHLSSNNEIGYAGDCNDAVYMESQAFLMHEIMTDGMAFCTIM